MNKQQLAAKIWESANKMRSKIEANEYKDYILGFIFYKFLSETEVTRLHADGMGDEDLEELREDDTETAQYVRDLCGYFISYDNLFSTWVAKKGDFAIANVRDALSAFDRNIDPARKRVFAGIFDTLQTGLSKLGTDEKSRSKAARDLIYLIKDIPMDSRQDYDTLGFIYEYLISNFASNAGKKAGEFYTPSEVSQLMSEIVAWHLAGREEINIYDPTSGSGSLLIHIGQAVARRNGNPNDIRYYAQELKENTYNLTRMNLVMRGILPDNIVTRNGDTLEEDWPYFEENDPVNTYDPLFVDAVVSNPPYSQAWNPNDKENNPRFSDYGLAPKGKADYAFLLHDLYHIRNDGIVTIVLPHGVLFRGGEEGTIRKNLIDHNNIDAIIGLPANIFFGTGIPTIIMVLRKNKKDSDVLIIDASKGFEKDGKNNKLRACDIKRIVDAYKERPEKIEKFARRVSRAEIIQNDYNLNIPRYVDSSEKAESWDIYASMFGGIPEAELQDLSAYWTAFPHLKAALFSPDNEAYCHLNVQNLKNAVLNHPDVVAFKTAFQNAFGDFDAYLKSALIDGMTQLNAAGEEERLSREIFARLAGIPLVDRYAAYQLLDDDWKKIAIDLEIIQTEGFAATKQVDPNMVLKKDAEVQDGWVGHVLPFELVQNVKMHEEVAALRAKETRLSEIAGEYESHLDELSEEDKEQNFVNDAKDAFVAAEVKKAIKAREVEPATLSILKDVDALFAEEKTLKKKVKDDSAALHQRTKSVIEHLTDEEVCDLLHRKWILPLMENLNSLPDAVLDDFVKQLDAVCKKYETTFEDVESQIADTEHELLGLLDDLQGNEFDMKGIAELKKLLGGE